MFGTDLNQEYEVAARLLDLDEAGIAGLARNAVDASFMDDAGKAALSAEIDGYLAAHTTGTTAGEAAGSSTGSTGA